MADATRETPQDGRVETSHHPGTDPEREERGYYGIPPIKEHTWTWEIPIYFWLGGIGAGSHIASTIARTLGHKDRAFLRAARYTTLITMHLPTPSPSPPRRRPFRSLNDGPGARSRTPPAT